MFKKTFIQRTKIALLTVLSMVLLSTNTYATTNLSGIAPNDASATILSTQDIAKKSNSVVYIEIKDKDNNVLGNGSGFIISEDGKIITNFHVIDKAYYADVILEDGIKYNIEGVINYNKDADLAVIKLENYKGTNIVTLGDSSKLQLGDSVVAIGSPEGYKNTVSVGIVSGFRTGQLRTGNDIQISNPISSGSSGGALFNMQGEVVGITYASRIDAQNLNFAIPINDVKTMINGTEIKTLAQVQKEVYPEFSLKELETYLKDKYPSCTLADETMNFTKVYARNAKDNKNEVFVIFVIDLEGELNYLDAMISDGRQAKQDIENWSTVVIKDIMQHMSNKDVTTCIYYNGYYERYPSSYPALDIKYQNGKWHVMHMEVMTLNVDGKIYHYWTND